jgi:hypothetical protein
MDTDATLAATANRIATTLAEAMRADVRARFLVGDELHKVRYLLHGSFPVRALARRLGCDESGLQRIARVAERIGQNEREALLAMSDARGFPLSWSHFEELQHVSWADMRAELARKTVEEGLSVRKLRLYIHTVNGKQKSRSGAS